jgi:malonyl CoA-acyl carrier protein transacylase
VHPDAVIGHSMGEVSAAVVAGALTAEQGFAVIAARSRLMSELAGPGAVALLDADAATTETLIADYPGVEVAGYLSPRQTVVAGPVAAIEALLAAATAANRFARRVNMEVASHTALMDPVCEPLRAESGDHWVCEAEARRRLILEGADDSWIAGSNAARRRLAAAAERPPPAESSPLPAAPASAPAWAVAVFVAAPLLLLTCALLAHCVRALRKR